jgi:hypothetical protein
MDNGMLTDRDKTIRHWGQLLREGSPSQIFHEGFSKSEGLSVCSLVYDEEMHENLDQFQKALDRIADLALSRESADGEALRQIWKQALEMERLKDAAVIHAAELMFDTLVGFFLE